MRPELTARATSLALLVLVVALLCFLMPVFRPGEPLGDDLSIHFGETAHLARALAAGDFQGWNPGGNLGFPSGYYYQVLPQLVPALAKLALPWASILVLFKLAIVLPLVLTPLACFRALRVVGVGRAQALGGAAAVACVVGSSSWGLGSDSMFVTGLYTQGWAMLFYPLALAHGARYLVAGEAPGRAAGYAVLAGLCHPFIAFCLAPALALTPWWRATGGIAAGLRRAVLLLAAVMAATAFFWLPILVHHDSFGGFPARLKSESGIEPGTFACWLLHSNFLDAQRPPLLAAGLVTALALVWRRRGVLAVLLAQAALFALFVMLGPLTGKVKDDLIAAVRFLAPMQLALAAAAGMAVVDALWAAHDWLAQPDRPRWMTWRPDWLRWVPLFVGAVYVAVLLGTTAQLTWWRERTSRDFADLHRGELDELMAKLARLPSGRVLGGREWGTGSHWWLYLPWVYQAVPPLRAFGGGALQSSPNFVYLREDTTPFAHADLWGLRYALALRNKVAWPEGEIVAETKHHTLWASRAKSFLFAPVRTSGRVGTALALRRKAVRAWVKKVPPLWDSVLELGDVPAPVPEGDPARARVLSESEGFSRYRAEVEALGGSTRFALRVSYHPAWRATVDGQPARIVRIAPDLMALDVPAGTHRLELVFRRPWWSWLLVALTLAGFGAHAARRLVARRRVCH